MMGGKYLRARLVGSLLLLTVVTALQAACGSSDVGVTTGHPDATADGPAQQFTFDGSTRGRCQQLTCAALGANCGPQGDGCGGILPSCGTCPPGETCGGGGPSKCGAAASSPTCTKKTCADYPGACGPQSDGCGGSTPDCGACVSPDICGGGGVASRCGGGNQAVDGGSCVPKTCPQLGVTCGKVANGCGGIVDCGDTCVLPDICGGGGVPNVCGGGKLPDGGALCVPRTCQLANANCGFVADGCGGLLDCNGGDAGADAGPSCPQGEFCGGAGPNRCGTGLSDAGPACTGLCQQQVACDGGGTTTVTGTLYAPGGPNSAYGALPIPGALVYVPNGSVQPFAPGVSCSQCSAQATGNPLVSTTTAPNGTFTLTNVPAGANVPLVVQLGRWRRQITIANVDPCTNNVLPGTLTRLPANQSEGDIPLIAVATGNVDGLECVLRKMGIADSEFTSGSGTGRIRLFRDNGASPPGGGSPPNADALWGSPTELAKFDAVINACRGGETRRSSQLQKNLVAYADAGGRVFNTHFSYVWQFGQENPNDANYVVPWAATGTWAAGSQSIDAARAYNLDVNVNKVALFAQWLNVTPVNALANGTATASGLPLPAQPRIRITESRHDLSPPVVSPAERWAFATTTDPPTNGTLPGPGRNMTLHYAFNTPWGSQAQNQCGRVVFSDFHVTIGSTGSATFPAECNSTPLTAQEKILAYMLMDLTTCITPTVPPPPSCKPLDCTAQGISCGPAGDGCGGVIASCGNCTNGQTCGGGGVPGKCGGPTCTKKTCQDLNVNCGLVGDGCGGTLDCGNCFNNEHCGGSGANVCGTPTCNPKTCSALNAKCGRIADGCGDLLDCGACPPPQVCSTDNQCVAPPCTKRTCASANADCGALADGCGGLLDCGVCPPGQTCGARAPNQCGQSDIPK